MVSKFFITWFCIVQFQFFRLHVKDEVQRYEKWGFHKKCVKNKVLFISREVKNQNSILLKLKFIQIPSMGVCSKHVRTLKPFEKLRQTYPFSRCVGVQYFVMLKKQLLLVPLSYIFFDSCIGKSRSIVYSRTITYTPHRYKPQYREKS